MARPACPKIKRRAEHPKVLNSMLKKCSEQWSSIFLDNSEITAVGLF